MIKSSMLHAAALAATLLVFSTTASADFSGPYAPANWTISHVPDATADQGSVDASGAPNSITLIGSDTDPLGDFAGVFSRLDVTIAAAAAGTVSFNWSYQTNDTSGSPMFDPAGYIKTDLFQLTDDTGPAAQSGLVSFAVLQGEVFGFHLGTLDNQFGSASLTISNFSAPIPEPGSMATMALGLLGLAGAAALRRRRAS